MEILSYVNKVINVKYNVLDIVKKHLKIYINNEKDFNKVISLMDRTKEVYVSDMMRSTYNIYTRREYPEIIITVQKSNKAKGYLYGTYWNTYDNNMLRKGTVITCDKLEGIY
jgi:small-conductance mechanosensitive channel